MPERNWSKPDLDLAPRLDYAPPPIRRPWIDIATDMLDLIGGWLGLATLVGVYSILLAPWVRGLAAIFILFGTVILQIAIVFWLKKR